MTALDRVSPWIGRSAVSLPTYTPLGQWSGILIVRQGSQLHSRRRRGPTGGSGWSIACGFTAASCAEGQEWVSERVRRDVPELLEPALVGKRLIRLEQADPSAENLIRLQETVEPPRQVLFHRLNMAPGGTAAIVLLAAPLALLVPLPVLAGILVFVAWNMGEWREFAHLRKYSTHYRVLMLGTFALTVVFDLTVAVQVGLVAACVLFPVLLQLPLRVLPNDLDTNLHLNNGRYLTLMDLGRVDLMLRMGVMGELRRRRWNQRPHPMHSVRRPGSSTVSSQIAQLRRSGANVLMMFALPKQTIGGFIAANRFGWRPPMTAISRWRANGTTRSSSRPRSAGRPRRSPARRRLAWPCRCRWSRRSSAKAVPAARWHWRVPSGF